MIKILFKQPTKNKAKRKFNNAKNNCVIILLIALSTSNIVPRNEKKVSYQRYLFSALTRWLPDTRIKDWGFCSIIEAERWTIFKYEYINTTITEK